MHNMSCENLSQEYQNTSSQEHSSVNRFIFIRQHIDENSSYNFSDGSQKILVNPNFKKNKVFVNPKFSVVHPSTIHVNPHVKNLNIALLNDRQYIKSQLNQESIPLHSTKIHINPNAKNVQLPLNTTRTASQSVHINPNFKNPNILSNVLLDNASNISHSERKENVPSELANKTILLTRTKLIRTSVQNSKKLKRRNSVKSKYKIVRSPQSLPKTNHAIESRNEEIKSKNRYKIDHRRRKSLSIIAKNQRKYLYINRFLSISDLAKNQVIKSLPTNTGKTVSIVNIRGVVYRNSRMSLRKASISSVSLKKSPIRTVQLNKSPRRTVQVSKYKLVKSPVKKVTSYKAVHESKDGTCGKSPILKQFKIVRKASQKKIKAAKVEAKVSPKPLRKCNIPCPYYKKYGFCKGKGSGKCFRKHDPDQITLCTRFLQGACIKERCSLSHNVSPEKMPTCKYYLEGSCSRENCPYLHIKINPKAEVCRDFLEGFCKKAAECDKRHQYLCPDHEKYGNCLKQRCPYPHGKMVRNYISNMIKFAKKCSDINNKFTKQGQNFIVSDKSSSKSIETDVCKNEQAKEKQRYYEENKSKTEEIVQPSTSNKNTLESTGSYETDPSSTKNFIGLQSRPKLGILPAFIPLGK